MYTVDYDVEHLSMIQYCKLLDSLHEYKEKTAYLAPNLIRVTVNSKEEALLLKLKINRNPI